MAGGEIEKIDSFAAVRELICPGAFDPILLPRSLGRKVPRNRVSLGSKNERYLVGIGVWKMYKPDAI